MFWGFNPLLHLNNPHYFGPIQWACGRATALRRRAPLTLCHPVAGIVRWTRNYKLQIELRSNLNPKPSTLKP